MCPQPPDKRQVNNRPNPKRVTDSKHDSALLCIQRDLGIALSSTRDLSEGLTLLLKTALRMDAVDCGAVYLVNDAGGSLELAAHHGLSPHLVERRVRLSAECYQARPVLDGLPYYGMTADIADNVDSKQIQEGLASVAVIPVRHDGHVVATLNLASHSQKKIPSSTRTALEVIAAQSGAFIVHAKADEKLRESEEKYRKSFENDSDAVMIFDTETLKFEDANRTTLNL